MCATALAPHGVDTHRVHGERTAIKILLELLNALAYAHRDLLPHAYFNVLLEQVVHLLAHTEGAVTFGAQAHVQHPDMQREEAPVHVLHAIGMQQPTVHMSKAGRL